MPKRSVAGTGSSKLDARRWLRRTCRLSGLTRPCSGELSNRYSGCAARNWSMGADEQTSAARLVPDRRPERPICCQVRGDGAGVADADGRVEAADVDPELQRVGGHHAAYAAVAQPRLDLVALVGQVAAAIAADRVRMAGRRLERLAAGRSSAPQPGCASWRRRWSGLRRRSAARPAAARSAAPSRGCRAARLATGGLTTRMCFRPRGAPLS